MSPPKNHDDSLHQLIVIHSMKAELLGRSIKMLPADVLTVGRHTRNDIVLDSESASRRHARFELRAGRWWVVDLDSTNGLYVNDQQAQRAELKCGDRVHIGGTIFKLICHQEEIFDDRHIFERSPVDGLTGLSNRRTFREQLDLAEKRTLTLGASLALAFFDIDHFKKINDTFGHLAGDSVLRQLGSLAKGRQRPEDTFARYGGEEFVWLMPDTDLPQATNLAEAFRQEIEGHSFTFEAHTIPVTLSAGVSRLNHAPTPGPTLLEQADQKLFEAKRSGRNRVLS